ncbi:hypothetical protein, partial [Gandjariella thermophila]|uniref:hypothetical protein n=1 Tax=Gandjariella thermophila TaxID=1931992 RepID=UPI001CEFA891
PALSAVGDWVKAHLKDIHAVLSTVSAIAGLVALVTPPPVDVIALGVSAVAGAGALATDLADPQFRHGIGELLHCHFNKDSMGALMTGVGDAASLIPGAKIGAAAATEAIKGGDVAARVADVAVSAAHEPGLVVKGLGRIPGVSKLGEAVTFGDKVLSDTIPSVKDGERVLNSLDRLNLMWRVKGVGSSLYHDAKEAFS